MACTGPSTGTIASQAGQKVRAPSLLDASHSELSEGHGKGDCGAKRLGFAAPATVAIDHRPGAFARGENDAAQFVAVLRDRRAEEALRGSPGAVECGIREPRNTLQAALGRQPPEGENTNDGGQRCAGRCLAKRSNAAFASWVKRASGAPSASDSSNF